MRLSKDNTGEQNVDSCTFSVLVAQSCLTLFDPMDCGSPGSSVHGILQARILEWVAILQGTPDMFANLCPPPGFTKAGFPPQFAVSLAASEGQA